MGQTSGEQQRNVPPMVMAPRVAARKGVCFVARLAKGTTIGCAALRAAIPFSPQRGARNLLK